MPRIITNNLQTDPKVESIFHALKEFFKEKEISLNNILSVAADGAPATIGRYRGETVQNAFAVHFVIHRQHLVAKNLSECRWIMSLKQSTKSESIH